MGLALMRRYPVSWSRLVIAAWAFAAGAAKADPIEPPPGTSEGEDSTQESADTLASGAVELGIGVSGAAGQEIERRRRVRFADPDLRGTVREGSRDPLAGGLVEGRTGAGEFVAGKLSPRWGRGLLLGAFSDPWQRSSMEVGARRAGRTRLGEGVLYRRWGGELLLGRFSRQDLAGIQIAGERRLGLLAGRRGVQASAGIEQAHGGAEIAFDRRGLWRGEGVMRREAGRWQIAGAMRTGSTGFRSLAEPGRNGPSRALTLAAEGATGLGTLRSLGAVWSYRAGRAGGRLALEIERPLSDGSRFSAGFEEQRGVRRDVQRAASFRQGAWIEWGRKAAPLGLSARHESWGSRGALRQTVRTITGVGLDLLAARGVTASLAHSVYRVRRGESLYLLENGSDRLVLRALAGEGHRTRIEIRVPFGRGVVHAGLHLDVRDGRRRPPRWDVEWSRRSRPR